MSKINPKNLRRGDTFTFTGKHHMEGKVLYFETLAGDFIFASVAFERFMHGKLSMDHESISMKVSEQKSFHRVTKTNIPEKMRIGKFHAPGNPLHLLKLYRKVIYSAAAARIRDKDELNRLLAQQEILEQKIDKVLE